MERVTVSSGSPFEAVIGFSRAVRVGDRVAVSGTAPIGPDGRAASPGDAYAQMRRCLEIVTEALRQARADLDGVVRTRVFLGPETDWEGVARAHAEVFGNVRPACTFVRVAGFLDPAWLVEVEADAVVGEPS